VQINVSQLLKAPIGSIRKYKINETINIAGGDCPAQGEVQLMRADDSILAKGGLRTDIKLTCGRCLSPFHHPLTLNIEEEFFPTTDVTTGAKKPSPGEPGIFTIDAHNVLDLTEAARQYALLAIPIKPLCGQDCAGLCPTCGANLNQIQCDCPPKPADPRWAGLIKLASNNKDG